MPRQWIRRASPFSLCGAADARNLPIPAGSADLVVTSPPYWRKRDYGYASQIGQEPALEGYVANMALVFDEMARVLTPTGSVFLNVGDTYVDGGLAGVPYELERAARERGWIVPNRIVWAKPSGMPSPHRRRLVSRHEVILHMTRQKDYYYDLDGYLEEVGASAGSGDVWNIPLRPTRAPHLAPFPPELVERAIRLASPHRVCTRCGQPESRVVERTAQLNPERAQARRAMELAKEKGVTPEHIRAIQATGICDAGKAQHWQTGAGGNSEEVQRLAAEAKKMLGGYFREFTFPLRRTVRFSPECRCKQKFRPGVVLDPFAGSGTTPRVARELGRSALAFDHDAQHLRPPRAATEAVTPGRREAAA